MSINWQMDKEIVEYPHNGIVINNKIEPLINETTWKNLKILTVRASSQAKRPHSVWAHLHRILENVNNLEEWG